MPNDPFSNARAYYDVSFPSSGDGFNILKFRNAFAGLGFMDFIPLQPRAHSPADTKIMVRGQDASSFVNPVYFGDANQRTPFASGDTPAIAAPSANPRIDVVYLTPSGDIRVVTGTEAASPTIPTLAPSGDSRLPVCALWCRPGQTKIVNFEDNASNPNDGYIYKDLRPWLRTAGAGSSKVGDAVPVSPTGDAQAGPGTATTAARVDHVHAGVRTFHLVGSGDMFGDIQMAGEPFTQAGNRITLLVATATQMKGANTDNAVVTPRNAQNHPGVAKAMAIFDGTVTGTNAPTAGYNCGTIQRVATGEYKFTFIKPMSTTNYFPVITPCENAGTNVLGGNIKLSSLATDSFSFYTSTPFNNTHVDASLVVVVVFGTQ